MEKRKISDDLVQKLLDREEAQVRLLAAYRIGGRPTDKTLDVLMRTAAVPATIRQRLGIPLCTEDHCLELAIDGGACAEHRQVG